MSAPRRIAFYTDSAAYGGAEMILGTLIEELDASFEVSVAGSDAAMVERLAAQRPGARARVIPAVRNRWDFARFVATVRDIRALDPQIFHANLSGPSACRWVLAACALIRSVRTVAVEHLPYPLDSAMQLRLKRFTSKRLAAHVAVGQRSARQLEAFIGLPPGSVRTIYNGVPDLDLKPLPRSFDGPVIGSLGRLERQKGFDLLLRAMVEVPGARLVIVGDGDERQPLERLAVSLGLGQRVSFAGWQDEPRRFLTTFDVFALPSRFEAFPLSIVEAMLARLPVVATAVGSVAEAISDGATGLLVGPEDPPALSRALRELVEDEERRAAMGRLGRERALAFTTAAMVGAYQELYEEVLQQA